jgi:Ser/Thr protein kinase RdoA (MazF antagonist)
MLKPAATKSLATQAIAAYGFDVKKLLPQQSGYRNVNQPFVATNGQTYNLIIYKNEPGIIHKIKTANAIGSHLSNSNLPARYPLTGKILQIKSNNHTKYACLYNYLPGRTIPWEAYEKKHLKSLGKTLLKTHQSLEDAKLTELDSTALIYSQITKTAVTYFEQRDVQKAMAKKLGCQVDTARLSELARVIEKLDNLPDKQPLHMDLVRGNVLFSNNPVKITGLIDFEKSSYGHPYFDIARTLSFLLVDCKYKTSQDIRKYFLNKGYFNETNDNYKITVKLPKARVDLLETLVECFLVYDFYKFLAHNPYEYLNLNEHYTRTKDLLISKNLVVKTTY